MSFNHFAANRNSTPDVPSSATLRPPSSRLGMASAGHHLRASADMGALSAAPMSARSIRPASEVYYNPRPQSQTFVTHDENMDNAAQQWIADIDQYENTLEEMAAATLDQEFKDELSAIEQWFRVLSEAERTAALYALLQQTTHIQVRFFIGVLQQMARTHPVPGMISPSSFGERDAMSNRLSCAMGKLAVDNSRSSVGFGRPPPSPSTKRLSGLDPAEISSMFPDAAAAIAKQKADFTHHTGSVPNTSRNSTATVSDRNSLITPTITTPLDDHKKDPFMQPPVSPWAPRVGDFQPVPARPKSSSSQRPQPMGQFTQSPAFPQSATAGLLPAPFRSPIPTAPNSDKFPPSNAFTAKDSASPGLPIFSPFPPGASWASMSNTPMVSNFTTQQPATQADMVANATAMKLAAMSTVNTRIQLDDVRKYRRARSSEAQNRGLPGNVLPMQGSALPANFIMTNELGQVLSPQQAAAVQAQQLAAMSGRRSRPSSPGISALHTSGSGLNYGLAPQNGYLSAFDSNNSLRGSSLSGLHLGQYGGGGMVEGYLSDASEINRGRSPRGRRGSSKPPEDPTDLDLLKDIPNWLRSLRLHKYTDNLKDMRWQDLIMLDDDGLDRKGVNALGARRKMTKIFEQVREAQAMGKF